MNGAPRPSVGTSLVSLPLVSEEAQSPARELPPAADPVVLDADAIADFRAFLQQNKEALKTGMGAFHTDNHSNW